MLNLPLELLAPLGEGLINLERKETLLVCRYKHKVILIDLINKVFINLHEGFNDYIWAGFGALGGMCNYEHSVESNNENHISILHWNKLNGNKIDTYRVNSKEGSLVIKRPLLIQGVKNSRVNHVLKLIKDPVSAVGYHKGIFSDSCISFQTELTTHRFSLEGSWNVPLVVLESIDLGNKSWSHQVLLINQVSKDNNVIKLEINYTNSDIEDTKLLSQYLINTHKSIISLFTKRETKCQGKELYIRDKTDIYHTVPFDISSRWDELVRLMKRYGVKTTLDTIQCNF